MRYQATPLAYPCSGTGCLCTGGIGFAAAARSTGYPGHECLTWQRAGYLHRKCSIPIPQSALPLLIREKKRMRFYEKVVKVKADVGGPPYFFSATSREPPGGAWRAVKGAVFWRSS